MAEQMTIDQQKYEEITERVRRRIARAESYDEGLKKSLRAMVNGGMVDHVAVWFINPAESNRLYAYYTVSPLDMTDICYDLKNDWMGSVIHSGKMAIYKRKDWAGLKKTSLRLSALNASVVAIVPIASGNSNIGCIEFIKSNGKEVFGEKEADLCTALPQWLNEQFANGACMPTTKRKKETVISVRDIKKSFRTGEVVTNVLKGVNFNVYKGEFLCLLGESGCGKTTTLNVIGGMDRADEGYFTFLGKDFSRASERKLTDYRRYNIGFIFQAYNLMPNLTAKQNLELIGELVDRPRDPVKMLRIVGMEDKQDNYPSQLSGGQQQRVSIARALVKDPKVILADEPTAALDYTTSIEVLSAIEDVLKTGTTLVMVTHNEEITKMADRVIRFRDGKTFEVTVNQKKLKANELVW